RKRVAGESGVSLRKGAGTRRGPGGRTRRQRFSTLGAVKKFSAHRSDKRTKARADSSKQPAACVQQAGNDPGACWAARTRAGDVQKRGALPSEKDAEPQRRASVCLESGIRRGDGRDSSVESGESAEQVSPVVWTAARDDDRKPKGSKNAAGRSHRAASGRAYDHQFARSVRSALGR